MPPRSSFQRQAGIQAWARILYVAGIMKSSKSRKSVRKRSLNLAFRPKSYWPPGRRTRDEVEIVRITVSSASRDAIVLKAGRGERGRIVYRMVHEDAHGPTRQRIRVKPATSARPLTLGEVIAMLEGACYAGRCDESDERYRGVIWGTLQLHFEHGVDHADDYLFLLKVSSRHYRQLERHFDERLNEWCLANCIEEEECGKVVRLRTGRFPLRL